MLDDKPLILVDVPFTPVIDPLFVDGIHEIVYEPALSCKNPSVIAEVVDNILVGESAFSGTGLKQCYIIAFNQQITTILKTVR